MSQTMQLIGKILLLTLSYL